MPERTIHPYWHPAPTPAAPLREGVVDVWRVELPAGAPRESADGVLRGLLGSYLSRPPEELEFEHGPQGKPALAGTSGAAPAVSFNLSHSGPLVLLAFTQGGTQVGIDLEVAVASTRTRARDEPALAARLWGPLQAQRLRALPPPERATEFLRLWTAHEAALKCTGAGLSGAAAAPHPAGDLWVAELLLGGKQAAAAVAVETAPTELRFWSIPAPEQPPAARRQQRGYLSSQSTQLV